jgi:hypothetical protein
MRFKYSQTATLPAALLLLAVLFSGGTTAWAQNAEETPAVQVVVVVGVAPVQAGQAAAAREAALANGMVAAVALAAVEILTPEEFAENFKKLGESLLEHPENFIQDFKVLSEAASAKQHRVLVQATVASAKLREQVAAFARAETKPAAAGGTLLLIAEQEPGQPAARYWWGSQDPFAELVADAAAARVLRERNFAVLDSRIARRQETVDWTVFDRPELSPADAAALGRGLKAELVVVGRVSATAEKEAPAAGTRSFRGAFEGRVIRVETAREIGRVSRFTVAGDPDAAQAVRLALAGAAAVGAEALATEVASARQQRENGSSQVRVTVEGTGNLAHFVRFRKSLAGLAGVGGIQVREMKPTATTLVVTFKGAAPELASALRQQSFDGFGVVVSETGDGSLKVILVAG